MHDPEFDSFVDDGTKRWPAEPTLLRLMHRSGAVRRALAPAGRMALTAYLAQSAIGLIVFSGVGAGLAGTFSPSR
ncbi:hypothetical protein GCM10009539_04430 [Cryptosporangium japonicum]|uniref:DUF418 domain-containing protein n=1 Tax=Cryptosporangium japonicum TaxID=80872 RepID=A0ABN0TI78_9ACTN